MDPLISLVSTAGGPVLLTLAVLALWRRMERAETAAAAREAGLVDRVRQLEDQRHADAIELTSKVVAALETSAEANKQAAEALDRNARAFERWAQHDSDTHPIVNRSKH